MPEVSIRLPFLEQEPVVRTEDGFDVVEMSFSQIEQVSSEELKSYLVEHAGSIPH